MTSASLLSPPLLNSCYEAHDNAPVQSSMLAEFLDALPLPGAIFDSNGELSYANGRFRSLWIDEALISRLSELLTCLGIYKEWLSCNATRFECEVEAAQCNAPFSAVNQQLTLTIAAVSQNTGETQYLVCLRELPEFHQDMLHQRHLHARLLHTSRAQSVGEMTTILSHELNQPLGSIVNYLDAAQKLLSPFEQVPARVKDALRLAQAQAHQASAVIARIREFVSSRQTQLETCDIGSLIRNAMELSKWELQRLSIRVYIDIADDLPRVEVDPVLLGQVLTNLVHNAIDAMRSTPPHLRLLRIEASLDLEQRIMVRVCDSGVGVAPNDKKNLFKPFFTTKPKGMGIGLSISRSIMELHAGSLYHESMAQGGSAFCFTLPTPHG